jgi:hypothetical protein
MDEARADERSLEIVKCSRLWFLLHQSAVIT